MINSFSVPHIVYSRANVQDSPKLIPTENGIYFWWIKNLPDIVPLEGCIQLGGIISGLAIAQARATDIANEFGIQQTNRS